MGESRVAQIYIKDYHSVEHADEDRAYTQSSAREMSRFSE